MRYRSFKVVSKLASTEKQLTAKMVLDSTGFNSSIKGVNNNLKLVQSELKNANVQVGAFGRDSEKLKSVQETLAKKVELHAQKVNLYRDSIDKATIKMNENIKERDKFKISLENANKKYEDAIKTYGKESEEAKKAKAEVDNLTKEYEKKEKTIESNAKQIQYYETSLNKAEAEMGGAKAELQKINTELDKSNNKWLNASESLKKSSKDFKNVGNQMSSAGDSILKLTAPVVGAGAASLKFATDFEDSMAKVSTIADDAEVPIGKLGEGVLKLSDDTGIAATDIANNVYDAISAGQKTGNAVNFVTNSTKLAKAGFAEAGASLDVLTSIMNAYKKESTEVGKVSDILIQTQNKGKVTVGELSSVMGKVIPTAVATNVSLEQLGAGYAIMTSNGIKAAESTTYMNGMLNEMSKSGSKVDKTLKDLTGKSFNELMESGQSVGDVLATIDNYAQKNNISLKDMFGSTEAGKAALVLATNAGQDFNSMLADMNNATGATDEAFKKVSDTSGEKLKKSLNELRNVSIKFGDAITPILDTGSELLGKFTDKLGEMDEEQIKTIANIALFTVGLGGVLKIGGGAVSAIGSISGGLSTLTGLLGGTASAAGTVGTAATAAAGTAGVGGLAGMGTAISGVLVAAAPWALGIAAVVGTGYAINKAMSEEAVPAIDLFADKIEVTSVSTAGAYGAMATNIQTETVKISDATKQAVGAYIELDDQARSQMLDLQANSSRISEDIKNQMTTTYSEMSQSIVDGFEKQKNESLQIMNDMLLNSVTISQEEKTTILDQTNKHYEDKKATTQDYENQINGILTNASNRKRALTQDEVDKINELQNNMRENAVQALSQNEIEAKVILQRMKDYDTRITAEQASEHIKTLNKSRDDAIKAANEEYDQRIALIEQLRADGTISSQKLADDMIAEAKRQRDGTVDAAKQTRDETVDKIFGMNNALAADVDESTGDIVSNWQKLFGTWDRWNPKEKTLKLATVTTQTARLASIERRIANNAVGTDSFSGGLTTLHEKGYEVYDLPRGTRIFPHEASEDIVRKTASEIASDILANNNTNVEIATSTRPIILNINGREFIKATLEDIDIEMKKRKNGKSRIKGAYSW